MRFKALDETGVVGVVCRHEHPIMLLSMRHGERLIYANLYKIFNKINRLSYIVYLLEKLKDKFDNLNINILYDIACMLKKHLLVSYRLAAKAILLH